MPSPCREVLGAKRLVGYRLQRGNKFFQENDELLIQIGADRANSDVVDPGVDKSTQAVDATFDGAAGGPDFHAFSCEVFLVIGIEKSLCFAKRSLSIAAYRNAVV